VTGKSVPSSALLEEFWRAFEAKEAGRSSATSGHLVLAAAEGAATLPSALCRFEGQVRARGAEVFSGSWRPALHRPFGGLLELAERLLARCLIDYADVVARYGAVLVSLLPGWEGVSPLQPFSRYRSGLADYALHGNAHGFNEFFRRREVSQAVSVALVRFILDGAAAIAQETGHPTVLCLERVNLTDRLTARTLRKLGLYARELPVVPILSAAEASLDRLEAGEWTVSTAVAENGDSAADEILGYGAEEGAILAAAVFARPFSLEAWSKLLDAGLRAGLPAAAERLLVEGVLLPLPGELLAFTRPGYRDNLEESLSTAERTTLHCRALQTPESGDPFVAAWHASLGALGPQVAVSSLRALEYAWGSSAYEPALALAEVALCRDSSKQPGQPSLAIE